MRFYSGKTPCQGCGRPLDVLDDWLVIPVWASPAPVWVGFYHRACFELIPCRDQAVAKWRTYELDQLKSCAASTRIVASTDRYLLVYGSAEKILELFYLQHMARQRIPGATEWSDFTRLLADPVIDQHLRGEEQGALQSPKGRYTFEAVGDRVNLSWGMAVGRQIDFAKEDYEAYVAKHGQLQGFIDFPRLAESGMLKPVWVDGELARNRGVVTGVRLVKAKPVYAVTFDAPRRVTLSLSKDEFADLRLFLAGLKFEG